MKNEEEKKGESRRKTQGDSMIEWEGGGGNPESPHSLGLREPKTKMPQSSLGFLHKCVDIYT